MDVGLASPDAIAADYQTAAILDADKKILAYVEKVTHHAYKTTDTNLEGLKGCGWSEEKILKGDSSCGVIQQYQLIGRCTGVLLRK